MRTTRTHTSAAGAALLLLAGCFSHHDGGSSAPPALAPGVHALVLSASAGGTLPVPVGGIELTLALPQGADALRADTTTTQVADSSLHPVVPNAVTAAASGNVLANPRQVRLVLATIPAGAWSGDYLRMDFRVADGAQVTEQAIQNLNANPAGYRVVGLDHANRASVDLTGQVRTSLRVAN